MLINPHSRNKSVVTNKTFFKGASSFVLQVESSMRIKANDSAIRNHLGIDGRKADPAKNSSSMMLVSDKNLGRNNGAGFSHSSSRSDDG
jgi:hypothetical protein